MYPLEVLPGHLCATMDLLDNTFVIRNVSRFPIRLHCFFYQTYPDTHLEYEIVLHKVTHVDARHVRYCTMLSPIRGAVIFVEVDTSTTDAFVVTAGSTLQIDETVLKTLSPMSPV
jgi:hypothetical protein